MPRQIDHEHDREVVAYLVAGHSFSEAAQHFKTSESAINRIKKRAGDTTTTTNQRNATTTRKGPTTTTTHNKKSPEKKSELGLEYHATTTTKEDTTTTTTDQQDVDLDKVMAEINEKYGLDLKAIRSIIGDRIDKLEQQMNDLTTSQQINQQKMLTTIQEFIIDSPKEDLRIRDAITALKMISGDLGNVSCYSAKRAAVKLQTIIKNLEAIK